MTDTRARLIAILDNHMWDDEGDPDAAGCAVRLMAEFPQIETPPTPMSPELRERLIVAIVNYGYYREHDLSQESCTKALNAAMTLIDSVSAPVAPISPALRERIVQAVEEYGEAKRDYGEARFQDHMASSKHYRDSYRVLLALIDSVSAPVAPMPERVDLELAHDALFHRSQEVQEPLASEYMAAAREIRNILDMESSLAVAPVVLPRRSDLASVRYDADGHNGPVWGFTTYQIDALIAAGFATEDDPEPVAVEPDFDAMTAFDRIPTMFTGYDLRRCSDERLYGGIDELNRRLTGVERALAKSLSAATDSGEGESPKREPSVTWQLDAANNKATKFIDGVPQ